MLKLSPDELKRVCKAEVHEGYKTIMKRMIKEFMSDLSDFLVTCDRLNQQGVNEENFDLDAFVDIWVELRSDMKWEDDEYSDLKWTIFDMIRSHLEEEHAQKVSVQHATDCIDLFIEELINPTVR